ncbi:glycosyltransferase [Kytococcus sedentarius]|uniref:glycosyltransferase n=1 Tax=Kytococcus sedentarius TaxID=1276 RepID=UPI0035BBB1AF
MTSVVVGIPAHDEEDHIGPCLEAVLRAATRAVDAPGLVRRVHVVVAAHRCTDATARRATALLERATGDPRVTGEVLVDDVSTTVGQVRDRALRHGAQRLQRLQSTQATQRTQPDALWLLSTDADSRVPDGWVEDLLAIARAEGASVVTGLVDLVAWEASEAERAAYERRVAEGLHPGGHWHAYGANLAVRQDVYAQVGGFPHRAVGEDVGLVQALRRAGAQVVSTTTVRVATSARAPGRARGGLGSLLADLARTHVADGGAARETGDHDARARAAGRKEHP